MDFRWALMLLVAIALVWSGVAPFDRATWWLEVAPVLIAAPLLVSTARRFPLTPLLYALIAAHAVILIIGGHYTYARVPAGFWVQDWLGLARNHYDRLGHFAQGFEPAILARELLLRRTPLRRGGWLFLLATASANTPLFARNYTLLLGLNGAITVGLVALVFVQLRSLWQEHRAHLFGSRLKLRLMAIFAAVAVVPGVLVYAVSLQFAVKSIESWFNVRVDAALDSGMQLGRTTLDFLLDQLAEKGGQMAIELETGGPIRATRLNQLREQAGVDSATVFAGNGRVQVTSESQMGELVPDYPSPTQLKQARDTRGYRAIEGDAASGLLLRVILPIPSRHLSAEAPLLQVTQEVPRNFAIHAESVQNVYRDYQELSLARNGLKRIYTLTLTLTLLLALFGAVAAAFVLTRRLAAPLLILAEGTEAVAAGDFSPRRALPARDELGVLTQSFNQMTRQLSSQRAALIDSHRQTEDRRRLFDSVLSSVTSGVVGLDAEGRVDFLNPAATGLLALDEGRDHGRPLAEAVPEFSSLFNDLRDGLGEVAQEEIKVSRGGKLESLLVRMAQRRNAEGGLEGYVVAFDDVTELVSAQRMAASSARQNLPHQHEECSAIQLKEKRSRVVNGLNPRRFRTSPC